LIEIINKQLLLQLVGYLCYWQMGFNSVFKGLIIYCNTTLLYMEGSVFKSRGQLACSYFSPPRQMMGCLTLGHNHFLPYP